jgi:hypothetical protein
MLWIRSIASHAKPRGEWSDILSGAIPELARTYGFVRKIVVTLAPKSGIYVLVRRMLSGQFDASTSVVCLLSPAVGLV